jgi:photosystem II stability/assembly factor-like uncharacterized protein
MIRRRTYEPLGIILATDEGLLQVVPGGDPEVAVGGYRFTSVNYHDGLCIAGAPNTGVWVHNGRKWAQRWEGDPRSVSVTTSGDLYIGATDGTLMRSVDKGESWEELEGVKNVLKNANFVPPAGETKVAVVSVGDAVEGIILGIAGGGAWYTRDDGKTWLRRSDGLDAKLHGIWVHAEQRDRLFATADRGVFRSEDEGFTWMQSVGGLDRSWGGSLAVLPGAPDTLVLSMARQPGGLEGAVFRSPNGGVTWQRQALEDEDEWDRVPCVVRPWDWEDLVFVAAGDKLFASHDRGRNWIGLGAGLPVANAATASV